MDSVSQLVLGASLAYVTLGKKLGKRSLLVGAALGTLPDLDVLVPYSDAVASFTFHRSWSHSLIVLSAVSPAIAWCLGSLYRQKSIPYVRWWWSVWLILITHALLDAFTVYGTQIWWPLNVQPTAWGTVFIIDPLYTLPLIAACILALRRLYSQARATVLIALLFSTSYLLWTGIAKYSTQLKLQHTMIEQQIDASSIVIAPFPLSLLWRTVVVTDTHYYEGYSSLLDASETIQLDRYDNGKDSCRDWLTHWPVQRLDWFTKGAYALSVKDNTLVASDLRMGIEDSYVFEFAIARWNDNQWQIMESEQMPLSIDNARMRLLFSRMLDERVDLTPIATTQPLPNDTCSVAQG